MNIIKRIVLLFTLLLLANILFAAVIATYTPEPYLAFKEKPGPWTSSTVMGTKLGTFTVTTTGGDKIYSPVMGSTIEVSGGVPVTGSMKNYANDEPKPNRTQTFYVITVSYPNGRGGAPNLQVVYGTYWPLLSWGPVTVNTNPFYVDLFLVNHNTASTNVVVGYRPTSYFKLDTPYSLPQNFNPEFSILTANNSGTSPGSYVKGDGTPNSKGSYIPTDNDNGSNQTGPDNTPIVNPGAYTDPENPGSPGIIFGDPPLAVTYDVSFVQGSSVSFSLQDAIGTARKEVNTIRIQVSNGQQGTYYTQQIRFFDSSVGSNDFRLLPQPQGPSPIVFNLYLDNTRVTKNQWINWNTLQNGQNQRAIKVGGITQNAVNSAASGMYSDTISVEIRNP